MNVTILPLKKGYECYAMNDRQVLLANLTKGYQPDGKDMIPFHRINYSLFNIKTNVREEILPEVVKHRIFRFVFASKDNHIMYFTHLEYPQYPIGIFILYAYDFDTQVCREVYRFEDNIKNYENNQKFTCFILNDQYLLFQIKKDGTGPQTEYQSVLYDVKNKLSYPILDERFTRDGISQMIPVAHNVCAIRFGKNQLEDGHLVPVEQKNCSHECVALVSLSQLIADVLLKLKIVSTEIIDEVYVEKTFSDIRKCGKYVVFSRVSRVDAHEEVFFYQFINKETVMLVNQTPYDATKIFPVVMNGKPMVVRHYKKYYEFYQLQTNQVVLKWPGNERILYCDLDFMVTLKQRKTFMNNSREERMEIIQFSSLKKIYKEMASPSTFLQVGKDQLLIFMEEHSQ